MPGRIYGRALWLGLGAGAVVLVVVLASSLIGRFDLPDWFEGGRSEPAPRGDVIYRGQRATAASEDFLVDIGDGEAVVAVKARQNHDKSGWLINGDFQSTNGTSSVSDPGDGGAPAKLRVAVDYCATGTITAIQQTGGDRERAVTFDLDELFVCDTTLEHTADNDAAFHQDDTPNEFHGRFVSFVAGAVETAAAAAACPTDELDRFRSSEFLDFVRGQLAGRFGVPVDQVEVTAPTIGHSSEETRRSLDDRLSSFLERHDPDHPRRTYEALSVSYLSGDGAAVTDSCYRDPGAVDLDDLDGVDLPDPAR